MVLGDFNIHNPISDPDRTLSANELALSNPYFLTALDCDYTLLNDPGSFTRHSNAQTQRPSVIDLCFANSKLLSFIKNRKNNLPPSGSDHTVIQVTITPPALNIVKPSPNGKLTPWPVLTPFLENLKIPKPQPDDDITSWFANNINALTTPLKEITPQKKPSSWSKSWWNPTITSLRTIFHSVARACRKGMATPMEVKSTRNAYFQAIREAKQAH
jgi:hypothetical protein